MSAHPLRDYQAEDVESIFHAWVEHVSTLYVAATGLGKTRVMVEVAHRMLPERTLFLAHRDELITQARFAFEARGLACEIEKAELVASTNLFARHQVVIASVQTLLSGEKDWKRMQRFDPKDFGLLLYDESHHAVSPGNKKIVDYFTQGNPALKVLGVTATPDRLDEEALGQMFQTVAAERDILWGRDNGWLVDVQQQFVSVGTLDFSEVRTTAGDLNGADLAAVMEAEEPMQRLVMATLEGLHALPKDTLASVPVGEWEARCSGLPKRRAIVFTVSINQAETLCNIFNRAIPKIADWVCGKTRDQDRKDTFDKFGSGQTSILVNVGVTTEGYDNPAVDMIVMGRPTKSRSLYAQCIGRGTRPIPGLVDLYDTAPERRQAIAGSHKPAVTVLDFCGNSGEHKLITTADLLGGKVSDAAIAKAVKKAKENGTPVNITEALEKSEQEIRDEQEARRRQEEARKAKLIAKASYTTKAVNPFDAFDLVPQRQRGWDIGRTLSEKQRELLRKQSIDPDSMPPAQAQQLLNEMFRRWNNKLCTFKQAKLLKKHGYDTKEMKMDEASKLIDALAKNKWRRPGRNIETSDVPSLVTSNHSEEQSPF